MGGKNHQPCSSYLPESTRLSRALSIAYAQCELANVALEDLILAELAEKRGTVDPFTGQLVASITALDNAIVLVDDLEAKMDENGFVDLPTLQRLDLEAIGANFVKHGMVNSDSWHEASRIMANGGFRNMTAKFREAIGNLRQLTEQLLREVAQLARAANIGEVNLVLEENRTGNMKPVFAMLYTGWGNFNALFLASSILSTEVWYAFRGHGSLAEPSVRVRAA